MKRDLDYSIKWSEHVKMRMVADREITYNKADIRPCLYRPFSKQYIYFNDGYVDRRLQNPKLFPTGAEGENICINLSVPIPRRPQQVLASNTIIGLDLFAIAGSISGPLYRYEDGKKLLNITDWGMELFRSHYPAEEITPEAVFAYCYGVLSSPAYQKKYADNLKTDYPRIPLHANFGEYRRLGQELINLHAGYESVPPLKNLVLTRDDAYLPEGIGEPNKNGITHPMKLDKKLGILHLDARNRIGGIPAEAFNYKIGSRSALDWVADYHKFKKLNPAEAHHRTLIEGGLDTYDWASIRAGLFDLVPRIVRVSVETVRLLKELEGLGEFQGRGG